VDYKLSRINAYKRKLCYKMKMASGGLPLIGNMLGKILKARDNSQDSDNAQH